MNKKRKDWIATFLAGFLATALGILLTFGIDSLVSSSKRARTANLLARQIVENMDRAYNQLHEYQNVYDAIDSGIDAYKAEILGTIGNVELIGHIDQFFSYARQYAAVSSQVIDQKRVVADLVYADFYGKLDSTDRDYVRYLHELREFNIFYSRMQNVRASLNQIGQSMAEELSACKEMLKSLS